jgi:hypothetical protein
LHPLSCCADYRLNPRSGFKALTKWGMSAGGIPKSRSRPLWPRAGSGSIALRRGERLSPLAIPSGRRSEEWRLRSGRENRHRRLGACAAEAGRAAQPGPKFGLFCQPAGGCGHGSVAHRRSLGAQRSPDISARRPCGGSACHTDPRGENPAAASGGWERMMSILSTASSAWLKADERGFMDSPHTLCRRGRNPKPAAGLYGLGAQWLRRTSLWH